MRWGDSCSSDEEDIGMKASNFATTEDSSSSESSYFSDYGGQESKAQPRNIPARFVTTSGRSNFNNNRRGPGGRSGEERRDYSGRRSGRGRGRSGKSFHDGGNERQQNKKSNNRKAGKQAKMSITIGASEWKEMAKDAKKYGKTSNGELFIVSRLNDHTLSTFSSIVSLINCLLFMIY